jgi:hypothetical protein
MTTTFDEIPSTRTVIVTTNINFNLERLFRGLPLCTNPHSRARWAYAGLQHGGITHVEYRREIRGVPWKPNPRRGKRAQHFFLNSVTMVMVLEASRYDARRSQTVPVKWKRINAKISHNGRFQLTGCQIDAHFRDFMECMLNVLMDPLTTRSSPLIEGVRPTSVGGGRDCPGLVVATFAVVMCNMDAHLGFQVNRERLDTFINARTKFISIYETSVNTSVNIKLPCENPHEQYMLRLECPGYGNFRWERKEYPAYITDWVGESVIKWKRAYHTFLVFTSGAIIQSSKGQDAKSTFGSLIEVLRQNRPHIEERRVVG